MCFHSFLRFWPWSKKIWPWSKKWPGVVFGSKKMTRRRFFDHLSKPLNPKIWHCIRVQRWHLVLILGYCRDHGHGMVKKTTRRRLGFETDKKTDVTSFRVRLCPWIVLVNSKLGIDFGHWRSLYVWYFRVLSCHFSTWRRFRVGNLAKSLVRCQVWILGYWPLSLDHILTMVKHTGLPPITQDGF